MSLALLLHPADDVAVLTEPVQRGTHVTLSGGPSGLRLTVTADLPLGHKIAVRVLRAGDPVRKYGEVIGKLTADVSPGEHVHVHNLISLRAEKGPV